MQSFIICLLALSASLGDARADDSSPRRPAVLFCSPAELGAGLVDLTYLQELRGQGFEVDYTTSLDDLSWERIRHFNVLLLYTGAEGNSWMAVPGKLKRAVFNDLLERFLHAGGGVLLFVPEVNIQAEMFPPELMERWGFRIPAERIREKNPANLATMEHMDMPLAYTDQVAPSPVSDGLKGLWYPYSDHYSAQATNPLWLDGSWQPVVRASTNAVTERVDFSRAALPLANPFYFPNGPVTAPVIFAVREYAKGRLAAISQWPQYSIGSGTKWLFDRAVLSKGLHGQPSDFGRLLVNTFRWLAAPSANEPALGGFVTVADKLEPPNGRADVRREFKDITWNDADLRAFGAVPANAKLWRGLIGAKSTYSSGTNTVAEYAAAAKRLGLDFLVIVDDSDKLTPAKLAALRADCAKCSDGQVRLFGGYTIESNIGNHLFCYGPTVILPPANCLTGEHQELLAQQVFSGQPPALDWVLSLSLENNVGHYAFTAAAARGAMRMRDCRVYSQAAVRYYRAGQLVEDMTDEFLVTAQGTIPPGPVSFNEVRSVAELEREVQQGHSLTYAAATSLATLFNEALRWTHQYDGLNLSLSDGPQILAWPACHRVVTYGGDDFATGRILMPARITVRSAVGLQEVRLYNGSQLYRRFVVAGAKEFDQLLLLEGAVQKNLVLVAEDVRGGRAVSYARRCWKDGGDVSVFCSDHCNDCKSPASGPILLAHGPYNVAVTFTPQVPNPGETWDGGPEAAKPLVSIDNSAPLITSNRGKEDGSRFRQTPLLEFTDEGAAAITSVRDQVYDPRVPYCNPWNGFGPTAPAQLVQYVSRFRSWVTPTTGPAAVGWAGPGVRAGVKPTLFRCEITFQQEQTIERVQLLGGAKRFPVAACFLVIGRGPQTETVPLTNVTSRVSYPIGTGEWFGLYSPQFSNSHLFINRGRPVVLTLGDPRSSGTGEWLWLDAALEGQHVQAGETQVYELACINYPLETSAKSAADFASLVQYLAHPTGLTITRGKLTRSPGLLDFTPDRYVAAFVLPKPAGQPALTLPARVLGLNQRWSAGLWLKVGYTTGEYGPGIDRYTPLGIDSFGAAYVPVPASWAASTSLAAGHPVSADARGKELFIQVTHLSDQPQRWHVSVNNPTDQTITTKLSRRMDLPGLKFATKNVTLKPGEYLVLE